jgi:hypothetical protein
LRDEGLKEEIAAIKQTTTGKWRFDPILFGMKFVYHNKYGSRVRIINFSGQNLEFQQTRDRCKI